MFWLFCSPEHMGPGNIWITYGWQMVGPDLSSGLLMQGQQPIHQSTLLLFVSETVIVQKVLVAQSCLTICDPCSQPGSSVHEIFQARILEWVAIFFSRGASWPRDQTHVSYIAGRFFTIWATREAPNIKKLVLKFIWKGKGTRIGQKFFKRIKWEESIHLIFRHN